MGERNSARIGTKGVLAGGLAAGMVINVSAVLMVPMVGGQMDAALAARGLPPLSGGAMACYGAVSLVVGVALV